MKKLLLVGGATALLSLAYASDNSGGWTWEYKPLKGSYSIYSGEPGEREAPTQNERKLAIAITGQAAKEIFDSLFPDAKVTCSQEKGERLRSKGEVWCIYQPRTGYRCFLGFNLRTGEPHSGAIC
jgi:hypothetical protein